jgi:hypothetical protein
MGRIGRVVAVGEAHHITHRGIAQQPIFHSEPARSTYLHLLGEQAARHKLRLLGYCLMTNQFIGWPLLSILRRWRERYVLCMGPMLNM